MPALAGLRGAEASRPGRVGHALRVESRAAACPATGRRSAEPTAARTYSKARDPGVEAASAAGTSDPVRNQHQGGRARSRRGQGADQVRAPQLRVHRVTELTKDAQAASASTPVKVSSTETGANSAAMSASAGGWSRTQCRAGSRASSRERARNEALGLQPRGASAAGR